MSVEYTYDQERNVLYTRFFGVVVDQDLRAQAVAVAADTRIRPGVRELVDLDGIEKVEASPTSLDDNIHIDVTNREKLAGMRSALIAKSDFLFGFARMYKSLAEIEGSPIAFEVFRTVSEARNWLGLDDDDA